MYSFEKAQKKKFEKLKRLEKLAQLELNKSRHIILSNNINLEYRRNIQEIWEIKELENEEENKEDEIEWNNFKKWNKVNDKSLWIDWMNENPINKEWGISEHIIKLKSGWEKTYLLKIKLQSQKEDEDHDKFHINTNTICNSNCYSKIVRKYYNQDDAYHVLNEFVFTEMLRAWNNTIKKFDEDHIQIHKNTKTICQRIGCLEANKLWLEVLRKN